MALSFHHRATGSPGRVAIFPGAWNPPTVAHHAIACAALEWAGEVVWVVPRVFPHKTWDGAPLERRLEMLTRIAAAEPGFSVAVSDAGLYVDIADEARDFFGGAVEIGLLCGRDAAERIATWDYGRSGVFEEMLAHYSLLVAERSGAWQCPQAPAGRIVHLPMGERFEAVSSTDVRQRIAGNDDWTHLVPETIVETVGALYKV